MVSIVRMPDEVDLGNGKKLIRLSGEEIEWGKGFSIRFDEAKYRLVETAEETMPPFRDLGVLRDIYDKVEEACTRGCTGCPLSFGYYLDSSKPRCLWCRVTSLPAYEEMIRG